eukprot:g1541.t1
MIIEHVLSTIGDGEVAGHDYILSLRSRLTKLSRSKDDDNDDNYKRETGSADTDVTDSRVANLCNVLGGIFDNQKEKEESVVDDVIANVILSCCRKVDHVALLDASAQLVGHMITRRPRVAELRAMFDRLSLQRDMCKRGRKEAAKLGIRGKRNASTRKSPRDKGQRRVSRRRDKITMIKEETDVVLASAKRLIGRFEKASLGPLPFVHIAVRTALETEFGPRAVAMVDGQIRSMVGGEEIRSQTLSHADILMYAETLKEVNEKETIEESVDGLAVALHEGSELAVRDATAQLISVVAREDVDDDDDGRHHASTPKIRRRVHSIHKHLIDHDTAESPDVVPNAVAPIHKLRDACRRLRERRHSRIRTVSNASHVRNRSRVFTEAALLDDLDVPTLPLRVSSASRHAPSLGAARAPKDDLHRRAIAAALRTKSRQDAAPTARRPRVATGVSRLDSESLDIDEIVKRCLDVRNDAVVRMRSGDAVTSPDVASSASRPGTRVTRQRMHSIANFVASSLMGHDDDSKAGEVMSSVERRSSTPDPWWDAEYRYNTMYSKTPEEASNEKREEKTKAATSARSSETSKTRLDRLRRNSTRLVQLRKSSEHLPSVTPKRRARPLVYRDGKLVRQTPSDEADAVITSANTAERALSETTASSIASGRFELHQVPVLDKLWLVFSSYAIRRYPGDVDHMSDAMAIEFLRDCGFLRASLSSGDFEGKRRRGSAMTVANARVLLRSIRSARLSDDAVSRYFGAPAGGSDKSIMFNGFLRLVACMSIRCRDGGRALHVHTERADQIIVQAAIDATDAHESETMFSKTVRIPGDSMRLRQIIEFVRKRIFPRARCRKPIPCGRLTGRDDDDMTGRKNAIARLALLRDVVSGLPHDVVAGFREMFKLFASFKSTWFSVIESGGYALEPVKLLSCDDEDRRMYWPQFFSFCEFVGIVPSLSVRITAEAYLSTAEACTLPERGDGRDVPFDYARGRLIVVHSLSYAGFVEALFRLSIRLTRVMPTSTGESRHRASVRERMMPILEVLAVAERRGSDLFSGIGSCEPHVVGRKRALRALARACVRVTQSRAEIDANDRLSDRSRVRALEKRNYRQWV